MRLSSDGRALWQKRYEYGWDWPNAVLQTSDGGFASIGVGWAKDQGILEDLMAMKVSADGTIGGSCNVVQDLNLTPVDTAASVSDTSATVTSTNATVTTTDAVGRTTDASPKYLCQG